MKYLALALAALTLTACSGDESPEEKSTPSKPLTVEVTKGKVSTDPIDDGAAYMDFTNKAGRNLDTLWFSVDGDPTAGTVDISRCNEPWDEEGKCEAGATVVLPNVDLAGWDRSLATGSMSLQKDQTAHLKFAVEEADGPVSFTVALTQPKSEKE